MTKLLLPNQRRASAPAAPKSKGLIIDVDDVAEERARRRSLKKRASILFKSLKRRHSVMTTMQCSHSDTSKTWTEHEEDHGSIHELLPQDQDPFQAARALVLSSSASLSSMSDHEEEEGTEEDTTTRKELLRLVAFSLLYKILSKKYPRKTRKRVSFAPLFQGQEEIICMEPVPHIPYLPDNALPKVLAMEIVLFRWPLKLQQAEPMQRQPAQLCQEIVRFDRTTLKKKQAVVTAAQPEETAHPNTELVALQQKCADLSKITELLSKQLVDATLNKNRNKKLNRNETKCYQDAIRQLEEQHRAHCAALLSDKKHLEGQLRYCKVESVPPVVKSTSTPNNNNKKKQQRNSFMDDLKAPVQVCLRSPMSTTASFSMASTMILQNKLMPALLSAVARANCEQ